MRARISPPTEMPVFPTGAEVIDRVAACPKPWAHLREMEVSLLDGWYRIAGRNHDTTNRVVALMPTRDRERADRLWWLFTGRRLPQGA